MGDISVDFFDTPLIRSQVFFPRSASPDESRRTGQPNVFDGTIPANDSGIALGYRLYAEHAAAPIFVFFHGNGEVAIDYDAIAPLFAQSMGASLLVVDYRGYGWSTGEMTFRALFSDSEAVFDALDAVLMRASLTRATSPVYVMGRSLGSAPAIHLAAAHPESFRGLIIESGFASVLSAFQRLRLPAEQIVAAGDALGNTRKLRTLTLPLLVIHGEQDTLLPIANGETLYAASAASHKKMVRLAGVGHNDLLRQADLYFKALAEFVAATR